MAGRTRKVTRRSRRRRCCTPRRSRSSSPAHAGFVLDAVEHIIIDVPFMAAASCITRTEGFRADSTGRARLCFGVEYWTLIMLNNPGRLTLPNYEAELIQFIAQKESHAARVLDTTSRTIAVTTQYLESRKSSIFSKTFNLSGSHDNHHARSCGRVHTSHEIVQFGGRSKASNLSVAAQSEAALVKNITETKLEIMH